MKIFKLPQPKEADIQRNVFLWAQMLCREHPELELLNASLNGVRLTIGQAKKVKKSGMRKGYPDLFLPVPRGGYHGLYIELKRKKRGKALEASDDQKWWLRKLTEQGYYTTVCRGFDETTETIINYLKGVLNV